MRGKPITRASLMIELNFFDSANMMSTGLHLPGVLGKQINQAEGARL
jgi:hypothetical protein